LPSSDAQKSHHQKLQLPYRGYEIDGAQILEIRTETRRHTRVKSDDQAAQRHWVNDWLHEVGRQARKKLTQGSAWRRDVHSAVRRRPQPEINLDEAAAFLRRHSCDAVTGVSNVGFAELSQFLEKCIIQGDYLFINGR
jgi:hypothetical protein